MLTLDPIPQTLFPRLLGGGDAAFGEAEFAQMATYNPRAAQLFEELMGALRDQ